MLMFRYLIYMIVALASVGHSFAQTVDAVGTAIIYNGDITDARYRATQQAIKQAVLQSSSRVSVNDILNNGELNSDLKIRSAGRVQHAKIISETQKGDFLTVVARVNVTADYMCSNGATNYYRKSVAITGFALEHRQQASLGGLGNISRELPKDFADAINKQGFLRALAATNIVLYPDSINAPSLTNNDDTLTDVVRIAHKLGTQYVVSGVIRDIAPLYIRRPNDPYASTDDKSEKQRDFVLDIYIYDGFSGALLFGRLIMAGWSRKRLERAQSIPAKNYAASHLWPIFFAQKGSKFTLPPDPCPGSKQEINLRSIVVMKYLTKTKNQKHN